MKKIFLVILIFLMAVFFSCEKEVSVSPPDAPPPKGKLVISTFPQKFSIFVDGKDRARLTPDSLNFLETGTYTVLLKKGFFFDSLFTVNITDGERTDIFINYAENQRMKGDLSISSFPFGAEIFLNDSNTAIVTPYTFKRILPGIYKVVLKLTNHRDISYSTTVKSSSTTENSSGMVDTTLWQDFTTENSGLTSNKLTSIAIDNNDVIWIGSRDGLIIYDGNDWINLKPGASSLPHQVVTDVSVDDVNRVWVGTANGFVLAENKNIITNFTASGGAGSYGTAFASDSITSIFASSGPPYWFATPKGLGSVLKRNFFISLPDDSAFSFETVKGTGNYITSIWNLENWKLLVVGTQNSGIGVKQWDDEKDTWKIYARPTIPGNSISAIYGEKDGVWIGHLPSVATGGGLSYFNGSMFISYNLKVPAPAIFSIFVDSRDIKYVGTDQGIYLFKDFSNRILLNKDNTGLELKYITDIIEDKEGRIWMTSKDNGLFLLKRSNHYFK